MAERGDYPADVSKLRKLLLALSDAKIVEEKTSNPASFPIIGVEDPSSPGATGAEISITARGTFAVIVGKPVGEGNFVRRKGENISYSVEPGISFESEPRFWIESKLIDIAAAKIQSVEVKPAAAGAAYTVRRVPAAKAAAGAVPFLQLAGTVIGGWLMARGAEAAVTQLGVESTDPEPDVDTDFLSAKVHTARHYMAHVMVDATGLSEIVTHGSETTLSLADHQF